jgi:O-antigen/teichoic acid export membrane protein
MACHVGLIFMFRSLGIALNEVVVALLDEAGSWKVLRRFTWLLSSLTTLVLLLVAATPLAGLWFGRLSGLPENLTGMALQAIWLTLPLPVLSVLQSWYQGSLLHTRQTRVITESVAIFLVICAALLSAGVAWGKFPGLVVGWAAFTLATLIQTAWLWLRSRPVLSQLAQRENKDGLSDELRAETTGKA